MKECRRNLITTSTSTSTSLLRKQNDLLYFRWIWMWTQTVAKYIQRMTTGIMNMAFAKLVSLFAFIYSSIIE